MAILGLRNSKRVGFHCEERRDEENCLHLNLFQTSHTRLNPYSTLDSQSFPTNGRAIAVKAQSVSLNTNPEPSEWFWEQIDSQLGLDRSLLLVFAVAVSSSANDFDMCTEIQVQLCTRAPRFVLDSL